MSEQELLKPLPHPVYFVCKNTKEWQDLMELTSPPPVEDLCERLIDGNDVWSVQTYVQLKRRGLDVHLVPQYIPGRICVTSYDHLGPGDLPFKSYVVTCRHDRARPEICEQRVVQNPLNVIDHTDHLIPLWPQPNLLPRDPSRDTKVENLVFKGEQSYLAEPFKSPEFLQQLHSLGVTLSVSQSNYETRFVDWADYATADVVLAVRNSSEYHLSVKPPSKLINAWFAGCPAFLGPEPAYQFLRKSELDYIEVRKPDDVISALSSLQSNPALYSAMVENGFQRAKDITTESMALLWRNLLAGPVADDYERWLRQPSIWKLFGRSTQFAWRLMKHRREARYFSIHTKLV